MPIYAYRCAECGHAKDVLQKLSDPLLTTCPNCGAEAFSKQLTAAGFQLKGSGWYVTDFRDGNKGAKADAKAEEKDGAKSDTADAADGAKKGDDGAADKAPAATPDAAKPAQPATAAAPAKTGAPAAPAKTVKPATPPAASGT